MGIDDVTPNFVRFLEVRHDEEFGDGLPVFARVEFTERTLQNINYMATILMENTLEACRLYTISTFNYTPEWYGGPEEDWEEDYYDFEQAADLPEWDSCKPVRMDAVTLKVSLMGNSVDFWWDGYLKHTGIRCTTRRFPVGELLKWGEENE